jgi:hypothetical protein
VDTRQTVRVLFGTHHAMAAKFESKLPSSLQCMRCRGVMACAESAR